jgi:hypothetical protein
VKRMIDLGSTPYRFRFLMCAMLGRPEQAIGWLAGSCH